MNNHISRFSDFTISGHHKGNHIRYDSSKEDYLYDKLYNRFEFLTSFQ